MKLEIVCITYFFTWNYDIIYISKKSNEEVRNLDEKEMRDTVENIIGIKIDNNKDKTIEDEVKEILNIKGE